MTLPIGISTCVVTFGRATSYLGTDATITGRLTVDRPVVWAADGTRIGSGGEAVPNDAGYLTFQVPHVDQTGFISGGQPVTGWLYTLTWTITYAGGAQETGKETFQVFVGQTVRDLDLGAGAIIPALLETAPQVTSVAGHTGAVTADDLAAAVPDTLVREFYVADDQITVHARRRGEIGAISLVGNSSSTDLAGVIPAGFRPDVETVAWYFDGDADKVKRLILTPEGDLHGDGTTGFGLIEVNASGFFVSSAFPSEPYPGTNFPF